MKRELSSDPSVLNSLIEKILVQNKHRVTVEMVPDPLMEDQLAAEEASRLADIKAQMDTQQIQGLVERTHELEQIQLEKDSEEAIASIPQLGLGALERKVLYCRLHVRYMIGGAGVGDPISCGQFGDPCERGPFKRDFIRRRSIRLVESAT